MYGGQMMLYAAGSDYLPDKPNYPHFYLFHSTDMVLRHHIHCIHLYLYIWIWYEVGSATSPLHSYIILGLTSLVLISHACERVHKHNPLGLDIAITSSNLYVLLLS